MAYSRYTFITGNRIEIIAKNEKKAEKLLKRKKYTVIKPETHLLRISFNLDKDGNSIHHRYPNAF